MLDFRFQTFLTLCKVKSYTKTASLLHITQPAVSQQIKFLENYYQTTLFYYKGRTVTLTEKGELLKNFAKTANADSNRIKLLMSEEEASTSPVTFGATLTIGEYIMPSILTKLLTKDHHLKLSMEVNNTEVLLEKLQDGHLDFIIVEGVFDKTQFKAHILKLEPFIGVCSISNEIGNKTLPLPDLFTQRLIVREKGSGTRNILEQLLSESNLSIQNFPNICEVGNMSAIKQLVEHNMGITFLYQSAVLEELKNHRLMPFSLEHLNIKREFNFVYLKNSLHEREYLNWFETIKSCLE